MAQAVDGIDVDIKMTQHIFSRRWDDVTFPSKTTFVEDVDEHVNEIYHSVTLNMSDFELVRSSIFLMETGSQAQDRNIGTISLKRVYEISIALV